VAFDAVDEVRPAAVTVDAEPAIGDVGTAAAGPDD
jgi:hypothetical protein